MDKLMYNYYERLDEKVRKFLETKAFFNVFDVEQKLNDVTFRNALNRVTEKIISLMHQILVVLRISELENIQ